MEYRIETSDKIVIRKKATRPYKAAWVVRDKKTNEVIEGQRFTTNPKIVLIGQRIDGTYTKFYKQYEAVIAIPLEEKE